MSEGDESLYGIVAKELSADRRSEALWTKAFALANGEEAATRATYIRLRVEQLKAKRLSGASPKVPMPARTAEAATSVGSVGARTVEAAHAEPRRSATTTALTTEDLYRAAIGPLNQAFYLDYFARADAAGKMLPSWNWPAAVFGPWWYFHRKLALWGIALLLLSAILEGFGKVFDRILDKFPDNADLWLGYLLFLAFWLVWNAAFGTFANGLYHRKVKRLIAEARSATEQPEGQIRLLEQRGGVFTFSRHRPVNSPIANLTTVNVGIALLAVFVVFWWLHSFGK